MLSPHGAVAVVLSLVASGFDLYARRIPNLLTVGAALAGLAFHVFFGGFTGLAASLAGLGVGLILFFPLFALGGMGAGDVKLLGALGAWLGPQDVLWTGLCASIAGGVMAVVVSIASGYLRTALENVWTLLGFWRFGGVRPLDGMTLATSKGPRLPYALPIAAGVLLALWLR